MKAMETVLHMEKDGVATTRQLITAVFQKYNHDGKKISK